jgi:lysozyme
MADTSMQLLRAQLIEHEGFRLRVYFDSVGIATIGVGRNLVDKGLSKHEALYLLDNDIHECIADLVTFPWFDALDPVRQRVLIDLRFNLGPRRFRKFRNTLAAIEEGRYGDAADGMLASKWAEQVKGRAIRLARMMRLGTDITNAG